MPNAEPQAPTQELETWEVKAFSAEDVATLIKDARARFKEEQTPETRSNCTQCHTENIPVEQHWNDVGGPDTVQCEMCWVDGIVWFWLNEAVAEASNA